MTRTNTPSARHKKTDERGGQAPDQRRVGVLPRAARHLCAHARHGHPGPPVHVVEERARRAVWRPPRQGPAAAPRRQRLLGPAGAVLFALVPAAVGCDLYLLYHPDHHGHCVFCVFEGVFLVCLWVYFMYYIYTYTHPLPWISFCFVCRCPS